MKHKKSILVRPQVIPTSLQRGGGRGGRGGRGGGRGGRGGATGGGPGEPSDDGSDSDPEPDLGHHPRQWQHWVWRRERARAMDPLAQQINQLQPPQPQVKP